MPTKIPTKMPTKIPTKIPTTNSDKTKSSLSQGKVSCFSDLLFSRRVQDASLLSIMLSILLSILLSFVGYRFGCLLVEPVSARRPACSRSSVQASAIHTAKAALRTAKLQCNSAMATVPTSTTRRPWPRPQRSPRLPPWWWIAPCK